MDPLYGQRTAYPKAAELNNKWVLIDAKDKTLGRLASTVAARLLGKDKVNFQPGVMIGDQVIVINSDHIKVSGNKGAQKEYKRHTGYLGGVKARTYDEQKELDSTKLITLAVHGMLPKTKAGRKLEKRLRVFPTETHNLTAQQPATIEA